MPVVADFEELGGAASERGVGAEHLMPQALVLVEQQELGPGARTLAKR